MNATIQIKKLEPHEVNVFIELIRLFEDVFEMKNFAIPPQAHLQQLLANNDFFVFVALSEDKIVGGLTAYRLQQYYNTSPLVYIYDLAVATAVQRQGIGKQLIAELTAYCKMIGVEEVFVQAEEADDYALDFYRATGAREEKVAHFSYTLNSSIQD